MEWPLGLDLSEAEDLASAAKAKGLETVVGLQGTHNPAYVKVVLPPEVA